MYGRPPGLTLLTAHELALRDLALGIQGPQARVTQASTPRPFHVALPCEVEGGKEVETTRPTNVRCG